MRKHAVSTHIFLTRIVEWCLDHRLPTLQAANSDAMRAALAELRGVTLAPTADPNAAVDSDLSSHAFYFIIAFYVLLVVAACFMWRRGMFSRSTTGDTDEWVQVRALGVGWRRSESAVHPNHGNHPPNQSVLSPKTKVSNTLFWFKHQDSDVSSAFSSVIQNARFLGA